MEKKKFNAYEEKKKGDVSFIEKLKGFKPYYDKSMQIIKMQDDHKAKRIAPK